MSRELLIFNERVSVDNKLIWTWFSLLARELNCVWCQSNILNFIQFYWFILYWHYRSICVSSINNQTCRFHLSGFKNKSHALFKLSIPFRLLFNHFFRERLDDVCQALTGEPLKKFGLSLEGNLVNHLSLSYLKKNNNHWPIQRKIRWMSSLLSADSAQTLNINLQHYPVYCDFVSS